MPRRKISSQLIEDIKRKILEHKDEWKHGTATVIAKEIGVNHQLVSRYSKQLGIESVGVYTIAEYVKKHPETTVEKLQQRFNVSMATICNANKLFDLGIVRKYKPRSQLVILQKDIEGKTFKEVREQYGLTYAQLKYQQKKHNLVFSTPVRKNITKIKHCDSQNLAKILTSMQWCENPRECDKNCVACCQRWLLKGGNV